MPDRQRDNRQSDFLGSLTEPKTFIHTSSWKYPVSYDKLLHGTPRNVLCPIDIWILSKLLEVTAINEGVVNISIRTLNWTFKEHFMTLLTALVWLVTIFWGGLLIDSIFFWCEGTGDMKTWHRAACYKALYRVAITPSWGLEFSGLESRRKPIGKGWWLNAFLSSYGF